MQFPRILVVDYGSQYTLLIAKAIRRLGVYSEIVSELELLDHLNSPHVYGVILSGGPLSVPEINPQSDASPYQELLKSQLPILGICYGAQLLAHLSGTKITRSSDQCEYGSTTIRNCGSADDPIYQGVLGNQHQVWMSHSDLIDQMGNIKVISTTENGLVAIFQVNEIERSAPIYGFQFHPEVSHTPNGDQFLDSFLHICQVPRTWNMTSFIDKIIPELKERLQDQKVMVACSGGVDSTVTAMILQRAIGNNMVGIFVDNGLLRKNEFVQVLDVYRKMDLNVMGVNVARQFYDRLQGITEPEQKRKIIGNLFIEVFKEFAPDVQYLGQGTIYPDVIESHGKIKSHHNVGGLPEKLGLELVEPLRELFKDEVREIGLELGLNPLILGRHPFPGPGLGIRILGEVTKEKVQRLQEADTIFISELKNSGYYDSVWQAGVILLDSLSVGVMGDNRTYQSVVALRAVVSINGMTASVSDLSIEFLTKVSTRIVNEVQGINRVVYDITSKPPGTIEWE